SKLPKAPPSEPPSAPPTAGCCTVGRNRNGRKSSPPLPTPSRTARSNLCRNRSVSITSWWRSTPPASAASLPLDPRTPASHDLFHFLLRGHGRVAGRGHRQRAVRRAVVHRLLGIAGLQETEDQSAGKTVPTPYAIENLQRGILPALVELAVHPANRAPIVLCRGNDLAKCRGGHL